jgi:hypothetical protein
LTATARDGDGNVRSGWKNARGAARTKEWSNNARQKWRDAPLTKKAPYKPHTSRMRESRPYGSVRGARDETRVPTATGALCCGTLRPDPAKSAYEVKAVARRTSSESLKALSRNR